LRDPDQLSNLINNALPFLIRFGATYVGASKVISMQEAYPILFGDIDMAGNLQAHILHAPSDNLRYKMSNCTRSSNQCAEPVHFCAASSPAPHHWFYYCVPEQVGFSTGTRYRIR
jgi:hypothetical protein